MFGTDRVLEAAPGPARSGRLGLAPPWASAPSSASGRSLETALQRVELAEELGYESVFVTHIAGARLDHAADGLRRRAPSASGSAPGVMPIYSRTPVATRRSRSPRSTSSPAGGRSPGSASRTSPVVEHWYGQTIDKPLREMREYVAIVRAIMRGEDPPQGEHFRTGLPLHGLGAAAGHADLPRRPLARHAAAGRRDRRRRGALALQPELHPRRGGADRHARDARGRAAALEGFDIVAAVPSAVTDDPDAARERLRGELCPTSPCPSTARCSSAVRASTRTPGPTDEFLEPAGARSASADEARASVRRYAESRSDLAVRGRHRQDRLRRDARGASSAASTSQRLTDPSRRSSSVSRRRAPGPRPCVRTVTVARSPFSVDRRGSRSRGRRTPSAAERSRAAQSAPPARLRAASVNRSSQTAA